MSKATLTAAGLCFIALIAFGLSASDRSAVGVIMSAILLTFFLLLLKVAP